VLVLPSWWMLVLVVVNGSMDTRLVLSNAIACDVCWVAWHTCRCAPSLLLTSMLLLLVLPRWALGMGARYLVRVLCTTVTLQVLLVAPCMLPRASRLLC
jgi:hypothetical protein